MNTAMPPVVPQKTKHLHKVRQTEPRLCSFGCSENLKTVTCHDLCCHVVAAPVSLCACLPFLEGCYAA